MRNLEQETMGANLVDPLAGGLWVINNEAVKKVWHYGNDPVSVD